uniref:Uncharacterized protein n=1 Tax=Panagrolaimus sp. JU765 TaxID=591449 RepID=A0AC34RBT9_9BILA
MDGAEISFRTQTSEDKTVEVLLKYLGNNTFEVATYPYPSAKIKIDTRLDARKRQILKLSTTFSVMQEIEFCVTSSSNRTHPSFIGFLEETDQEFVIEGARPSDWLKVRIYPPNSQYVILHYTQQMLDKHFPRQSYPTDLERITKINNILGCQIKLTQAADLHKVI